MVFDRMDFSNTFNPRTPYFWPVMVGGPYTTVKKYTPQECIDKYDNYVKSYKYWDKAEDNYFYYPHVFLSAFYSRYNLKEKSGIDRDRTLVFADSGGFQLLSKKATPESWTRAMALGWAEDNASITPILDWPSRGEKSFTESLAFTDESARYAVEHRSSEKLKILNVVSGADITEYGAWIDKLRDYPLDGWAHGGGGTLIAMVEVIILMINKGIYHSGMKPAIHHLFGISSPASMTWVAFVQRMLNQLDIPVRMSYDASSASMAIGMGKWTRDININGSSGWAFAKKNLELKENFNHFKVFGFGCDCPVCRGITNLEELLHQDTYTSTLYLLGFLNNVYHQLRFKHSMDHMMILGNQELFTACMPRLYSKTFKVLEELFLNPKTKAHSLTSDLIKVGHQAMESFEPKNPLTSFMAEEK